MKKTLILAIAITLILTGSLFADGKVTTPPESDPVAAWGFLDIRNAIADPNNPTAFIEIGYFTQSGKFHHAKTVTLREAAYERFLGALTTSADAEVEATMTKVVNGQTYPDAQAIFRFRIGKYLIAIGELPSDHTAEKVK